MRRQTCILDMSILCEVYRPQQVETNKAIFKLLFESQQQKTYLWKCAPSEDSDLPAHPRSLIRIFTGRVLDSQGYEVSSCGHRRLWSDGADAQADLSLRWEDISKGTSFHVMAHIFFASLGYECNSWKSCETVLSRQNILDKRNI